MQYISVIILVALSYKIWNVFTHPNSKIWQGLPRLKNKHFEIFPSIKFVIKGRTVHFHHWFTFSILLCVSIFVPNVVLDSWVTRGFLMGGVIQGLLNPTARKLIYK